MKTNGCASILVADSDPLMARFLGENLLPGMGYESLVARNIKEVLEKFHTKSFDLLILSESLDTMSAGDVLEGLSKQGASPPVILTVEPDNGHIPADYLRLGVRDFLRKPLETNQLSRVVNQVLGAAHQSRLNEELSARLQDQKELLEVISRVGRSITSTLDTNEVLQRIVEACVDFSHASQGFLALIEPESGKLYLRAMKNIDEKRGKTMRLLVNDPVVGEVIRTRRPIRKYQDKGTDPLKVSTGFLVRSLLHVPVLSKGKMLGVLTVTNQVKGAAFSAKDEFLLSFLADYAAVALENAALYQHSQTEIAERKSIEAALRESEERYALAVQGANDGLWDWNLAEDKIYYSPRWKLILGYKEDEIEDSPDEWWHRVHPADHDRARLQLSAHLNGDSPHFQNEHRIQHKNGSYRWVLCRGMAVWNGKGTASRIAGSMTDITDRKLAEEKILRDAFFDPLTNLPNRALFHDRLRNALEHQKWRSDNQYAVLFFDIDRFKDINDTIGHTLGDQLLTVVADRLAANLRTTDTVARMGGDEFAILLDEVEHEDIATEVADRIQKELSQVNFLSEEVFLSTSIGIISDLSGYSEPEDVIRDVDIAMYIAKAEGRARYKIFQPEMRERVVERTALEIDLRQSIEKDQLYLEFQPIIALKTGEIVGLEALARWANPERGKIPPDKFIPIAEEIGMIDAIDHWCLQQACRHLQRWNEQFTDQTPLTVNVNLSGIHFRQTKIVDQVNQVLFETGIPPHCLKLEITESILMRDTENARQVLAALKDIGVELLIDDFGTGYSSLSYLQQFPVNAIKVDRAFVQAISMQDAAPNIVPSLIDLAHNLGLVTVAEGLETRQQLEELRALGCEYGQGYFLSEPLSVSKVEELLEKQLSGE